MQRQEKNTTQTFHLGLIACFTGTDVKCSLVQINVLLQAYISQLKLEGFALMADMVYVTQVTRKSFQTLHIEPLAPALKPD